MLEMMLFQPNIPVVVPPSPVPEIGTIPLGTPFYSRAPSNSDFFGKAVAISGNGLIAIAGGAPDDPNTVGRASVFMFIESTWQFCQDLIPSNGSISDGFGSSVAISYDGAYIAIGAPKGNQNGVNTGAVHIFAKNGNSWTQETKLVHTDGVSGDFFGYSVSLSSDGVKVMAAAYSSKDANTTVEPKVYVFTKWQGVWGEDGILNLGDTLGSTSDFGRKVSLSADGCTGIVSAYLDNSQTGAVYVFSYAEGIWNLTAKITPSDATEGMWFGGGITISPDGLVISITTILNSLYVYRKDSNTGNWVEEAKLETGTSISYPQAVHCESPVTSTRDGSTIVVGDPGNNGDSDQSYTGAVWVFNLINGVWVKASKATAATPIIRNRFGSDVSIDYDNQRFVVGTFPTEDPGYFEIFCF